MLRRFFWLSPALCLISFAQHEKQAEKPKHPFIGDPTAIAAGQTQFANGCAGCHGPEGGGGRGPNLQDRGVWHPIDDDDLYKTIQEGVGVMPGANLPPDDAWRLVAFVRSLTSPAYDMRAPGDAEAGKALYWGKGGCANCHTIEGKGGKAGPDLSNIALKSTVPKLRQSISEPDAVIAEGYQSVDLVLRSGQKLKGFLKNRTNYSLQLQEQDGALRLINMGDVEQLTIHSKTIMPTDYRQRLTLADLNNLVAYLARQATGAPHPPAKQK